MTPQQVYNSPFIREDTDLYHCNFEDHISNEMSYNVPHEGNVRVTIREHFLQCADGERTIQIASAWLDGKPFMAFSNAGRGNSEYQERYITDVVVFHEAISYLRSLLEDDPQDDVIDANEEAAGLTNVYNAILQPEDMGKRFGRLPQYFEERRAYEKCAHCDHFICSFHSRLPGGKLIPSIEATEEQLRREFGDNWNKVPHYLHTSAGYVEMDKEPRSGMKQHDHKPEPSGDVRTLREWKLAFPDIYGEAAPLIDP